MDSDAQLAARFRLRDTRNRSRASFEGVGNYPVAATLSDTKSSRVVLTMTYSFSKPGTHFPVLRATSQREGDPKTPYARVQNIGRARVVVK